VLNLYSTVLPGDLIQTATISRWFSLDTKFITALARLYQIVFLGRVPSLIAEEPSQVNDSWFWTMWSAMSLSFLHHRRCKARTVSLTSFSSLPAHIGTSKTQQSYWWQKKFPRVWPEELSMDGLCNAYFLILSGKINVLYRQYNLL